MIFMSVMICSVLAPSSPSAGFFNGMRFSKPSDGLWTGMDWMFQPGDLGGGFKYVLLLPLPGEMIPFDEHIFQRGWNHQLVMFPLYSRQFVATFPAGWWHWKGVNSQGILPKMAERFRSRNNVSNRKPSFFTSRTLTARPWKMMVGRLLSYWGGKFPFIWDDVQVPC